MVSYIRNKNKLIGVGEMNTKQKRIIKHLTLLEKIYNVNLQELKKDIPQIIDYKCYKRNIKTILINLSKFKSIDLKNFLAWYGGINVIKLDSFLFNQLIGEVENLHGLSGLEKLEIYTKDKKELKKIKYLI